MKKVYEIKAEQDNGYGRGTTVVERRLYTTKEEADAIAEKMVKDIMERWPREWWMHYDEAYENGKGTGKPAVWAAELEVEGL